MRVLTTPGVDMQDVSPAVQAVSPNTHTHTFRRFRVQSGKQVFEYLYWWDKRSPPTVPVALIAVSDASCPIRFVFANYW